jgi:hypothetical protein
MKAEKIAAGLYLYRGWIIEKMEAGHWNMRPRGLDVWTDAAQTLGDAKKMIDRWRW